ncbi:unnamed protein product [Closterium sp. NIES-54]
MAPELPPAQSEYEAARKQRIQENQKRMAPQAPKPVLGFYLLSPPTPPNPSTTPIPPTLSIRFPLLPPCLRPSGAGHTACPSDQAFALFFFSSLVTTSCSLCLLLSSFPLSSPPLTTSNPPQPLPHQDLRILEAARELSSWGLSVQLPSLPLSSPLPTPPNPPLPFFPPCGHQELGTLEASRELSSCSLCLLPPSLPLSTPPPTSTTHSSHHIPPATSNPLPPLPTPLCGHQELDILEASRDLSSCDLCLQLPSLPLSSPPPTTTTHPWHPSHHVQSPSTPPHPSLRPSGAGNTGGIEGSVLLAGEQARCELLPYCAPQTPPLPPSLRPSGAGHTGGIEGSVRLAGEQANCEFFPAPLRAPFPSPAAIVMRRQAGSRVSRKAEYSRLVPASPEAEERALRAAQHTRCFLQHLKSAPSLPPAAIVMRRQKGSRVSREADYSRRVPASPEAEERALRAALSLAEALKAGGSAVRQGEGTEKESEGREGGRGKGKGEAMVKAMVRSHVHGCFWLGLNRSFCTAHLPRSIATLTLKVDPPQGTADPKSNTEADSSQGTSEVTFESTQKSPDSKSSSGGGDSAQGTGESKDSAGGVDSSQGTSNSKDSTGGKGDTDGEGTRRDVKSDRKRARSRKQEPQEGGSEEGELQQLLGQRRAVMGGVYAVGEGEWRATYLPHKTGLSGGWRGFAMDQELDAGDAVVFEKMDSHTLKSAREVRQGDPLGPLLFAASIHPCLVDTAAAHPQVVLLAYADDITLLGDATACTAAFVHLTSALAALGLVHNPGKCAAWSAAAIDPSSVPPGISISEEGLQILGSPVGTPRGCAGAVRERLAAAAAPLPLLAQMDPQLSLLLLTRCVSRRASFLARTTPLEALPEAEWSAWGEQLLHTFLDSAHIMSPRSARERWRIWRQAALPVTLGGLGITDPAVESSYAYLTSVISAAHLLHSLEDSLHPAVAALLPRLDPTHGSPHALPARLAAAEAALPPEALEVLQAGKADPKGLKLQQSLALAVHSHRFLRVMREARRMRLNPRSGHAQRMQSVLGPGAGDWLLAIPLIPSLRMGPSQLSTPAAFRLCLPLPVPRRCDCRYRTTFPDDRLPNHLMCCEKGKGRTATHHALRDEIANIGAEAEFTVHKETYVYSLVENLKADVTIRHPLTGEVWMCDVTVTDPVSYQDENCNRAPGWAARAAAAKKKYARRNAWVGFHALAVETYGYPSPGVMAYLRQCAELAAKLRFNAAPTSYEAAKLLTEYRQRWSVCLSNIIYVVLV